MNNQTNNVAANAVVIAHAEAWAQRNPALAVRGIDESTWNALRSTVYPTSKDESILLAVDYCHARGLDVLLKPVHLVPMNVKNPISGQYEWRDVPMPGVGLYRIQAERSGTYAGADAPEFGPVITKTFDGGVTVSYPEWCKYTVHKVIGDRLVSYTAVEYWEENYATAGSKTDAPNAMWKKRPRGQLAKCAEAQALRKGWPEIGQEPTAEEMEGKTYDVPFSKVSPQQATQQAIAQDMGITQEQIAQLLQAAQEVGVDGNYICTKARITSLGELTQKRFPVALEHLKSLAAPVDIEV